MELFAEVALLRDVPEEHLKRGQVGTVVDVHSPEAVEVEFVDRDGQTYALVALDVRDLLQLSHHNVGNRPAVF
jgi:hypothetical protein